MNKKYLKSHEWIKINDDNIYEIGISEYAHESLGDIVFIDFPEPGKKVKYEQDFCTIESVKAASDLYSPVDGEIVEINKELESDLEAINKDPENVWIVKIKSDSKDFENLLDKDNYKKYIEDLE